MLVQRSMSLSPPGQNVQVSCAKVITAKRSILPFGGAACFGVHPDTAKTMVKIAANAVFICTSPAVVISTQCAGYLNNLTA